MKKFSEIEYVRPDMEAEQEKVRAYTKALKEAKSYEELRGLFMEEKAKVTAAPTIAEQCGIKYKEVDGLFYPILGESDPRSYASLGKYGHRYLRVLWKMTVICITSILCKGYFLIKQRNMRIMHGNCMTLFYRE